MRRRPSCTILVTVKALGPRLQELYSDGPRPFECLFWIPSVCLKAELNQLVFGDILA